MTDLVVHCGEIGAECIENRVIASQCAHWRGNPHLCIRRMLSPLWGDSYSTVNYNLSHEQGFDESSKNCYDRPI